MPKNIPEQLQLSAQSRTAASLNRLHKAQQAIKVDLKTGKLARTRKSIDRAYVLRRAGLNPDFLKGPKHAVATREAVQSFVDSVNRHLTKRDDDPHLKIAMLREELAEWQAKYQRIADQINDWAIRLRSLQRKNRELKIQLDQIGSQSGTTVVSLKGRGRDLR
ncbi:hypothetical protein [Shinella zoogloeoides]|uniref:hypothetical protein n=1 Tax=Shinella zoogloeoides TaxID=352475 RepID=UPI001F57F14B|nr:hypothetical protein [Shinella zoogloeoides]